MPWFPFQETVVFVGPLFGASMFDLGRISFVVQVFAGCIGIILLLCGFRSDLLRCRNVHQIVSLVDSSSIAQFRCSSFRWISIEWFSMQGSNLLNSPHNWNKVLGAGFPIALQGVQVQTDLAAPEQSPYPPQPNMETQIDPLRWNNGPCGRPFLGFPSLTEAA